MGDAASVGRVFAKALGWFVIASLFSLVLGLIMANWLQPGHNLGLPLPDIGSATNLATSKFTLKRFRQPSGAQVLRRGHGQQRDPADRGVLHVLFGALAALGEKGKTLVAAVDELAHVMLKITGYVMKLAPLAVMAAMAATVAVNGLGILLKFAAFMGDFYTSLFMLWGLLILAGSSGRACSSCWC